MSILPSCQFWWNALGKWKLKEHNSALLSILSAWLKKNHMFFQHTIHKKYSCISLVVLLVHDRSQFSRVMEFFGGTLWIWVQEGLPELEVVWCGDPLAGGWVGLLPPTSLTTPRAVVDGVTRKNKNRGNWKDEQNFHFTSHRRWAGRQGGGAEIPVPDTLVVSDSQSCTLD